MRTPLRRLLPIVLVLVLLAACGGGKDKKTSATTDTSFEDTTSTLGDETAVTDVLDTSTTIAAMPIEISPSEGKPGTSFSMSISDFKPGEKVKFEISFPSSSSKSPFIGPERTIPSTGKLTVSYRVSTTDPTGEYTVKVAGDKGSLAEGRFSVSGTAARTTSSTRSGSTTSTTKKPASTTTTRAGATSTSSSSSTSTTRPPTTSTTVGTTTTTTP
jgi:hypothetical protein